MTLSFRHACVTFWAKPDVVKISNDERVRYIISGHEFGKSGQTEHWQAYVELNVKTTLKKMKEILNDDTCHVEQRKGTRDQARDYCMKENKDIVECGNWIKGQGARTDLDNVFNYMKNNPNVGVEDIALQFPTQYIKFHSGIDKMKAHLDRLNSKEKRMVKSEYWYGETGTGKTTTAFDENPDAFIITGDGLDWFDGYNGEKTLIIDEYNDNVLSLIHI